METLGTRIKNACKNNATKIIVGVIIFNTLCTLWSPGKDLVGFIYNDKMSDIVTYIINNSVKKEMEKAKVEYSLKLLELETKNIRKPSQIDQKILYWKTQKWNAQLAALNIVCNSKIAKNKLRKLMYSEQVYKALISYQ